MAIQWMAEGCDLELDPSSGALITKLTTAAFNNINIYCEQPYTTPDGRRIAYLRSKTGDPRMPPAEVCVADLNRLRVAVVEPETANVFIGTSAWSGIIYYLRPNGELIRLDLNTLEKQIMLTHWDVPEKMVFDTVSPDQRYLVGTMRANGKHSLVRVDMVERTWKIIYESEEVLGHLQINPVHGRDILVQMNAGTRIDKQGRRVYIEGAPFIVTHFYIDIDGGNYRALPVGPPYTTNSCGHSAWIADTGRIGLAVNWKRMDVYRKDQLPHRWPA